jgi:uncharacterized protein
MMSQEKIKSPTALLVFTRLPCEGRNKTRLIPALGAAGATALHDRLTRHTLLRVEDFCHIAPEVKLTIYLDGGSADDGRCWLGNFEFREQGDGDLGKRLERAVRETFAEGARKVLVIGTDCPDLDATHLTTAMELLDHHPLVFGPAYDGGYYLVGLSAEFPDIFQDIPWGGPDVLSQSLAAAHRGGLSTLLLPYLADVDLPEDLPLAEIVLSRHI